MALLLNMYVHKLMLCINSAALLTILTILVYFFLIQANSEPTCVTGTELMLFPSKRLLPHKLNNNNSIQHFYATER